MRSIPLMAGLAIVLAGCGGEKKAGEQPTTGAPAEQPAQQAPPAGAPGAQAPSAGGATHDVNMVLEGSNYKFVPSDITIKSGDVIRFHNVSGGPHNVSFWSDSVPKGAQSVLQANMPDQMAPLQSPLLTEPKAVYQISFANAPKGVYKMYCLPHLALGMKGQVTVQ